MNIYQIRGTSGSGKTWVAKKLLKHFESTIFAEEFSTVFVEGRKKPLFTLAELPNGEKLAILGHYESNCGGCDNIGSAAKVYELIQDIRSGKFAEHNISNIFCEGLLLSEDTKWTTLLAEDSSIDFKIIFLSTPIETCIKQIKSRREEVGNDKPLKEDNTRNRVKVIERAYQKLSSNPNFQNKGCLKKSSSMGAWLLLKFYLGLM